MARVNYRAQKYTREDYKLLALKFGEAKARLAKDLTTTDIPQQDLAEKYGWKSSYVSKLSKSMYAWLRGPQAARKREQLQHGRDQRRRNREAMEAARIHHEQQEQETPTLEPQMVLSPMEQAEADATVYQMVLNIAGEEVLLTVDGDDVEVSDHHGNTRHARMLKVVKATGEVVLPEVRLGGGA